jgi:HSP20 family protein
MSRVFGEALAGYRGRTPMWHPDIDVDETADGWVIEVRLPGVAPEEVVVDVADRELVIRSRHEESTEGEASEESQAQAPVRVRRWSSFLYRLTLPSEVDTQRIDATMDHGLLTVTLPRSTESRSRSISVGRREGEAVEGQATEQPAMRTGESVTVQGGEAQQAEGVPAQAGAAGDAMAGGAAGGDGQAGASPNGGGEAGGDVVAGADQAGQPAGEASPGTSQVDATAGDSGEADQRPDDGRPTESQASAG